jgi:hypothetical protein
MELERLGAVSVPFGDHLLALMALLAQRRAVSTILAANVPNVPDQTLSPLGLGTRSLIGHHDGLSRSVHDIINLCPGRLCQAALAEHS